MKIWRLILAAALILISPPGGWAGEEVSTEVFLPSADGRDAYDPGAAYGKGIFLVAWQSGNLADGDLRQGMKYIGDLVCCRVDKTGKVLDSIPLVLSSAPDLQERPRIAFGGGVFLAVWHDLRNEKDWDVYAARITPEGKVLDPNGVLIAGGAHNQAVPEVCWNGTHFQVVWQDMRTGKRYEVYGARVTTDGKVLEPEGTLLVTEKDPYSRFNPTVATIQGGSMSLLLWFGLSNNRNVPIAGTHLVVDGKIAGGPVFTNAAFFKSPGGQYGQFPASMCAGPSVYMAAWTTGIMYGRGAAANDAHGAIFKPDGSLEKMFLLVGKGTKDAPRINNPRSAWDGTAFVIAWDMHSGSGNEGKRSWPAETVFVARVSPAGEPSTSQPISGSGTSPAIKPAVASDGAGLTLIAYEKHPATGDVPIKIGFVTLAGKKRSIQQSE
ncbi:MAG: hypothetical protein C0404_08415 [Verrucomicrobia bacterium]|nr:hypothetical protein [Verrucomicrobiota bacterium]